MRIFQHKRYTLSLLDNQVLFALVILADRPIHRVVLWVGILGNVAIIALWVVARMLLYHTWTPLLLLAMTMPSFYRRARREGVSLEEKFGLEWRAYTMSVPMFLPRWKKKSMESTQ